MSAVRVALSWKRTSKAKSGDAPPSPIIAMANKISGWMVPIREVEHTQGEGASAIPSSDLDVHERT
jgi:hypothetical protein